MVRNTEQIPTHHSTCFHCGSRLKQNERRVNEALLYFLVELCETFYQERKEIKYDRITSLVKQKYECTPSDYAVLQFFGLTKKGEESGYWKPTRNAYLFLANQISIPALMTEFHDRRLFSEERIFASDITARKILLSWNKQF